MCNYSSENTYKQMDSFNMGVVPILWHMLYFKEVWVKYLIRTSNIVRNVMKFGLITISQ